MTKALIDLAVDEICAPRIEAYAHNPKFYEAIGWRRLSKLRKWGGALDAELLGTIHHGGRGQVVKERAVLGEGLSAHYAATHADYSLAKKCIVVAADGDKNPSGANVPFVGLPCLGVLKPAVDHHVTTEADAVSADVVAERLRIVF